MRHLCKTEELIQPTFFQRLLKIEPKENAFTEVNNLLATKPLEEIEFREIQALEEKYKVDLREKFINRLKDLYLLKLDDCLSDKILSNQDIVSLDHLKKLLMLSDSETEEMYNLVAGNIYQETYNEVIIDGKIHESEDVLLETLKENLKLPTSLEENISKEARTQFMQLKFDKMVSDGRISKEEWEEFTTLQNELKINIKFNESDKTKIEKLKLIWAIENEELQIVTVPINLQKNELCYFTSYVDWLENRTVTKRINYGGPTARIKIMKGVYYRAGSVNVQRVTSEELQLIDSGKLYLTNKRIIFVGNKKNASIQLSKILSINPFSDGVGVEKDSGKSPIFRLSTNADILAMTLTRVINDFQNA